MEDAECQGDIFSEIDMGWCGQSLRAGSFRSAAICCLGQGTSAVPSLSDASRCTHRFVPSTWVCVHIQFHSVAPEEQMLMYEAVVYTKSCSVSFHVPSCWGKESGGCCVHTQKLYTERTRGLARVQGMVWCTIEPGIV